MRPLAVGYGLFGFGYILPATFLPELARQLVPDPRLFGLAWPLWGLAATLSVLVAVSSATTDGADTTSFVGAPVVAASSATTDGADTVRQRIG